METIMTRTLATVARSFKSAVSGEDTARIKAAALAFEYVVTLSGKSADLATKSGVTPGKVSKHVATGKALALVPDADMDTKRAIVRTAHGEDGDRPALMEAIKSDDAAGVVAASKADRPESKGAGKGKGQGKSTVTLESMDSEALVSLVADALEALAKRDDAPNVADKFQPVAKFAAVLAKNLAKMPVTV